MSALGMGGFPPSIQVGGGATDTQNGGGAPQDAAPQKSDGDWETDLHAALDALRELAGDAEDHIEKNAIDKCVAALSALTAKRQQGAESALGVTPAHKSMSRAY
jgi:hypothetical protein